MKRTLTFAILAITMFITTATGTALAPLQVFAASGDSDYAGTYKNSLGESIQITITENGQTECLGRDLNLNNKQKDGSILAYKQQGHIPSISAIEIYPVGVPLSAWDHNISKDVASDKNKLRVFVTYTDVPDIKSNVYYKIETEAELNTAPSTSNVNPSNGATVVLNGKAVNFTGQQPVIQDGRTLVPVRGVFEQAGFTVDWNNDTRTVTLKNNDDTVIIPIGQASFTVNGKAIQPDVPARIINGVTMLPLRAICESLGSEVNWDGASQTAIIEYK